MDSGLSIDVFFPCLRFRYDRVVLSGDCIYSAFAIFMLLKWSRGMHGLQSSRSPTQDLLVISFDQ
jgi:hypothetical protein